MEAERGRERLISVDKSCAKSRRYKAAENVTERMEGCESRQLKVPHMCGTKGLH